jgi:23S rRNA (uracil1939-C5)-methyltransferase
MRVIMQSLSEQGKGVTTISEDGFSRAVFVPDAVPGDELDITIIAKNKKYYEGNIEKIQVPSPDRVNPVCEHFGVCGACDFLHISYAAQLQEKEKLLLFYLGKAGFKDFSCEVIASPKELHYRDKVRVQVQNGLIGFFGKKSHEIVPIKHCFLIREELNVVFQKHLPDGEARFAYDYGSKSVLAASTNSLCSYQVDGFSLFFSPAGFVQNNLTLNELLVKTVVEQAEGGKILDLYAGNGNFSLPLARKGSVVAVEGNKSGHALLVRNIAHNAVSAVEAILADADSYPTAGFDTVVLDPPRCGAGNLTRFSARKIIYVSCSPRQMVRDLCTLKDYVLEKVFLFDMFAQTVHFETVVVLKKKVHV